MLHGDKTEKLQNTREDPTNAVANHCPVHVQPVASHGAEQSQSDGLSDGVKGPLLCQRAMDTDEQDKDEGYCEAYVLVGNVVAEQEEDIREEGEHGVRPHDLYLRREPRPEGDKQDLEQHQGEKHHHRQCELRGKRRLLVLSSIHVCYHTSLWKKYMHVNTPFHGVRNAKPAITENQYNRYKCCLIVSLCGEREAVPRRELS